jgi:hypothetical protein
MAVLTHLKHVTDKVEYLLINHPETRDSDKLLYLALLRLFYGMDDTVFNKGYDGFKQWFMSKDTPPPESVRRCRQKLQEHNPELWGSVRFERAKEQAAVRDWAVNT